MFVITINTFRQKQLYVQSTYDGCWYLVRDIDNKIKVANLLARLKDDMYQLIGHLYNNKNEYKNYYIENL